MYSQITRSRYDCWKRKVLSRRRNVDSDGAEATSSGSAFHIREAETLKIRLLTLDSLTDSTTSRLVLAEHNARRPGWSATRSISEKYFTTVHCSIVVVFIIHVLGYFFKCCVSILLVCACPVYHCVICVYAIRSLDRNFPILTYLLT